MAVCSSQVPELGSFWDGVFKAQAQVSSHRGLGHMTSSICFLSVPRREWQEQSPMARIQILASDKH